MLILSFIFIFIFDLIVLVDVLISFHLWTITCVNCELWQGLIMAIGGDIAIVYMPLLTIMMFRY
ncbi:hypothetical protein JB92DRAFT_3031653 [Gautieria morchelliformis]|nr:hypothetical protein JB92DRAFT_3031653 [Gautieria morchelliformis]